MINKFLCILFLVLSITVYSQDWSKIQLGTGTGNCGPATVAMIIERSGKQITVQQARSVIGYKQPSGATSFNELKTILNRYNIQFSNIELESYSHGVMIILLDMSKISSKKYSFFVGRHYIVIFGKIGNYYRVYDPLIKGEQRYLIEEVIKSKTGEIIWVN